MELNDMLAAPRIRFFGGGDDGSYDSHEDGSDGGGGGDGNGGDDDAGSHASLGELIAVSRGVFPELPLAERATRELDAALLASVPLTQRGRAARPAVCEKCGSVHDPRDGVAHVLDFAKLKSGWCAGAATAGLALALPQPACAAPRLSLPQKSSECSGRATLSRARVLATMCMRRPHQRRPACLS